MLADMTSKHTASQNGKSILDICGKKDRRPRSQSRAAGAEKRRSALIVNDDIGFLLWTGKLLSDAGYATVLASNCREALSFRTKLAFEPDLVVVNPGLAGTSGMLERLQAANRSLKVMMAPSFA